MYNYNWIDFGVGFLIGSCIVNIAWLIVGLIRRKKVIKEIKEIKNIITDLENKGR